MLSINTNLPSLIAQSSLKTSTNKLNIAIERMTTGCKINSAKDNAANYSIAKNMSIKISAYQVAEDNVAMGLDMITTASESLDLINDKLARLRALAEQAANGTYGEQSLRAINSEACAIIDEIERLYSTTEFNGIKLLGDSKNISTSTDISETTQSVSSANSIVAGNTYTLSNKEDILKLAEFVNSGGNTTGVNFIMTNDINMSGVSDFLGIGRNKDNSFSGVFDGNGYSVKNLKIDTSEYNLGLFGYTTNAEIKNLGVIDCNINGNGHSCNMGAIVGYAKNSNISNCYSSGNIYGGDVAGGIVGECYSTIKNCYSTVTIGTGTYVGEFAGWSESGSTITNCVSILHENINFTGQPSGTIINSASLSLEDMLNPSIMANYGFTEANGWFTKDGCLPQLKEFTPDIKFEIQAGINSNESSRISITTSLELSSINNLRAIGFGTSTDYLYIIDSLIDNVSTKQTEYGAAQNRLESALEEISTHYENLVSSRSTLKDADISEVSAEYIKQNILQQASATLLSTANQSPALALQLI